MWIFALIALALAFTPLALSAQQPTFADPVAAELVARALETRGELGRSITSYTAVIRKRNAAQLRLPLRDRLLGRSEVAVRLRWSRDGDQIVQVLGQRGEDDASNDLSDYSFDPTSSRIHFGIEEMSDEDGMWIADPLGPGAEGHYRYASGDTITLRFANDRVVRAVELQVTPRVPSFHYMTALLRIDPESGSIIQAVYRPARNLDFIRDTIIEPEDAEDLRYLPGFFKPLQFELENVVIQYGLWDLKHWLPYLTSVEGSFRAGSVRVPFAQEVSYQIEAVEEEGGPPTAPFDPSRVVAGWNPGVEMDVEPREEDGKQVHVFFPRDRALLERNDEIPPPIWEDAPEFATGDEIESLIEGLGDIGPPVPGLGDLSLTLQWGLGGEELVRYNRVEGLSVGVRGIVEHPIGLASATVRLGVADRVPNVEVGVVMPRSDRSIGISAYHQLAAADPDSRPFSIGNSLSGLLFGRDIGEYYRSTGTRVTLSPGEARRQAYRLTVFAERQRGVERETNWSAARLFGSDNSFRPNLVADAVDLLGGSLSVAPWWGHDPASIQAGVEAVVEGAIGDQRFARSRLTGRMTTPVVSALRLGVEAGGGTSWGDLPAQYQWFLGGSRTLRGYDPSSAVGESFLRGRLELARGAGRVTLNLFGDGGWAGDSESFDADEILYSAGLGVSVLEGILRFDLSRALVSPTGWRVDMYLDALL